MGQAISRGEHERTRFKFSRRAHRGLREIVNRQSKIVNYKGHGVNVDLHGFLTRIKYGIPRIFP